MKFHNALLSRDDIAEKVENSLIEKLIHHITFTDRHVGGSSPPKWEIYYTFESGVDGAADACRVIIFLPECCCAC